MDWQRQKVMRFKRHKIPPLSTLHKYELLALAEKSDNEIDYSDIPETTDEQWTNAVRGKFSVSK